MSKVLSLVKFLIAFVFCMTIVNCGKKSTVQSAETETAETEMAETVDDEDDFVVSGNPEQMLDISNAYLEYLQSVHIENEDDVHDFENTMAEVKEMLAIVSDTLNARLEVMTPEEKGDLIATATIVSEKMEENNPFIMKEIQRLAKEAKLIGLTLPIDL